MRKKRRIKRKRKMHKGLAKSKEKEVKTVREKVRNNDTAKE